MRTPLLYRRGADVEEVEGAMAESMGERRFKTARHKTQDTREEEDVRGGFWIADCRLPIADCRLPIADFGFGEVEEGWLECGVREISMEFRRFFGVGSMGILVTGYRVLVISE